MANIIKNKKINLMKIIIKILKEKGIMEIVNIIEIKNQLMIQIITIVEI